MSEDFSAVADIATGAVLASAIEPDTGGTVADQAARCLNCQALVVGNHCHGCGQKAKVHRSLSAFWHDILHSVLHFDGKIWRTLPLLIWRPGDLTRRYVHGERARFVSPIALFLFTVFFTFAVFKGVIPKADIGDNGPVALAKAQKELASDRADLLANLKELEADRKEALADGGDVAWVDAQTAQTKVALDKLTSETTPILERKAIAERRIAVTRRKGESAIARLEDQRAKAKIAGQPTTDIDAKIADERMGLELLKTADDVMGKDKGSGVKIEFNFLGSDALKKAAEHAAENPQLLLYKIQSNAYKFSWALVPISTPFLWLLFFWRREFKVFDHAVFVTYSLCFMMMLSAVIAVAIAATEENSALFVTAVFAACFIPPIHMYRQIRRAYGTSALGGVWRTVMLSIFALLALSLFTVLIVSLGVTG